MRALKRLLLSGRDLTGEALSSSITGYDSLECERMLYRFENLGLLEHPRNMMTRLGTMVFHKLPLFDKLVLCLGL